MSAEHCRKGFDKEEWDVRVVIPNYTCIPDGTSGASFTYVTHFYMELWIL